MIAKSETAQHSTAQHSTQVLPLTTVISSPSPLNTTREELLAQKESLETQDKQIKEKDAIIKKLRELGKNYRAKFEASRKEVDELKGSLSSQEQVGGWVLEQGVVHVCWVGVCCTCVVCVCVLHVLGGCGATCVCVCVCVPHVCVRWAWCCTCVLGGRGATHACWVGMCAACVLVLRMYSGNGKWLLYCLGALIGTAEWRVLLLTWADVNHVMLVVYVHRLTHRLCWRRRSRLKSLSLSRAPLSRQMWNFRGK